MAFQQFDNLNVARNLTTLRAAKEGLPAEDENKNYRFIVWERDEDDQGKELWVVQDIIEIRGAYIAPFNRFRRGWEQSEPGTVKLRLECFDTKDSPTRASWLKPA